MAYLLSTYVTSYVWVLLGDPPRTVHSQTCMCNGFVYVVMYRHEGGESACLYVKQGEGEGEGETEREDRDNS